jgi:Lon protease-like protein
MAAPAPGTTAQIPLFPLNTVLFPGGPLPLRIFETRYTDMVRRCMREQSGFGVVMIQAETAAGPGPETDKLARTAETGTLATIVDFNQLSDGLLGITCIGGSRFACCDAGARPTA